MALHTRTLLLDSPDATGEFARLIGRDLAPGDVLLLEGPIGAGKTFFARSLIQSLLVVPEDVPSPTFTLVQMYVTEAGPLWHADLYRLSSSHEIEELGLIDAFETAICLVEWPDRLGPMMPDDALYLNLMAGPTEDARWVELSWDADKWIDNVARWLS